MFFDITSTLLFVTMREWIGGDKTYIEYFCIFESCAIFSIWMAVNYICDRINFLLFFTFYNVSVFRHNSS